MATGRVDQRFSLSLPAGLGGGLGVFRVFAARIGRAEFHPLDEVVYDRCGQARFRRHLEVLVAQRLDEEALVGTAGDQCGAGFAAGEEAVAGVEEEAAADFFRVGGMARIAVLDQDGADFGFEEGALFGAHGAVAAVVVAGAAGLGVGAGLGAAGAPNAMGAGVSSAARSEQASARCGRLRAGGSGFTRATPGCRAGVFNHRFWFPCRKKKGQRTGAVQNAGAPDGPPGGRASVLECGDLSPLLRRRLVAVELP